MNMKQPDPPSALLVAQARMNALMAPNQTARMKGI
jgi:hypothetical protein